MSRAGQANEYTESEKNLLVYFQNLPTVQIYDIGYSLILAHALMVWQMACAAPGGVLSVPDTQIPTALIS